MRAAMATYVQDRAAQIRTMPQYYKWFYNEWQPHRGEGYPSSDRQSWPVDTYKADIALLSWLHAELSWKFNEHRHDGGGEYGTGWGPVLPHWK